MLTQLAITVVGLLGLIGLLSTKRATQLVDREANLFAWVVGEDEGGKPKAKNRDLDPSPSATAAVWN